MKNVQIILSIILAMIGFANYFANANPVADLSSYGQENSDLSKTNLWLQPFLLAQSNSNFLQSHPIAFAINDQKCHVCSLITNLIKTGLAKGESQVLAKDEIIEDADTMCEGLGFLSGTCKMIVATYGKDLISLISHGETPEQACLKSYLCNS